jgi:hypothetical protein
MRRIALTDPDTGAPTATWFDADRATVYEEATHWDGSNTISDATGTQWDHEELYRTATGRWVLHAWSQWQGQPETYTEIPAAEATDWLLRNDHADVVPPEEVAVRELGAGVTPQRTIRMTDDLWQAVQDRARAEGTDASGLIRRLLAAYVASHNTGRDSDD